MRRVVLMCAALALAVSVSSAASASVSPDTTEDVTVSGVVTDAATGDPVADVCVNTRPTGRNYYDQQACTDSAGTYSFVVDAGKYEVMFDPLDDAYGMQWWDGADTPVDATELVLRRGQVVTGVDAALLAGATLTGRAIDGATGERLDNACIEISSAGVDDTFAYASDAARRWEVGGLPAGELTVRVQPCDNPFRFTWAYDALSIEDATSFDLEPGQTTAVGELALVAGATVKGKVTARRSGEPLVASVALDYYPGRSGEAPTFGTVSRPNGRYVIRDVQPGLRVPGAYDGSVRPRYAVEWAGGATTMADGTALELAAGKTAHASFRLSRAATIRGTMVGDYDYVLVGAFSDTFPEVGNSSQIGFAMDVDPATDKFVIRGLPADDIYVCFNDCHYDPAGFWYDGAEDVEDATLVSLKRGETVEITAHFPPED